MTNNITRAAKVKSFFLIIFIGVLWISIIYRLYFLQIKSSGNLTKKALKQHEGILRVEPRRGRILDRNKNLLAVSLKVKSVFCVPGEIDNIWKTARILSKVLKIQKNDLIKKLTKESKFVWLKRKIDDDVAKIVKEANFKGIYLLDEVKRFYPKSHLLSHVIGFVDIDNKGLSGIERFFDSYLKGESGAANVVTDAKGRELVAYRDFITHPNDGKDVMLTIDEVIQNAVEEELEVLCAEFKPKNAIAIVMDVQNGDILGLSNRPTFDLNQISKSSVNERKNSALINVYEPGSLFKVISAAAALNEKVIKIHESIYCEQGAYRVGGQTLHDSHPFDYLTFEDVIAKSSNIGFSKVMSRIDSEKFYEYIIRFGFNKKTGIPILGENKGKIKNYKKWSGYSKSAMAMGHEILVTPLQMATAISTVANGGKKIYPKLVDRVIGKDGEIVKRYENRMAGQIISKKTAMNLTQALKKVVSKEGTAPQAKIENYQVAGKTGTAQKFVNGKYSHSKYVSSFFGFLPADNPKISITIMVDEPNRRAYGGEVAAPAFSNMGERIINYLIPRPLASLDKKEGGNYAA